MTGMCAATVSSYPRMLGGGGSRFRSLRPVQLRRAFVLVRAPGSVGT